MQRRRPEYKPEDLRHGIEQLDVNINRLQKAIDDLRQRNEGLKQSITKNSNDIHIFTVEIGKLEHQKTEISRLIMKVEREKKQVANRV